MISVLGSEHNREVELNRPLSTLELTAMGVVLKRGPCNAHAVVLEFANSQTVAYRSGAGSIYPLLKRLAGAGLLAYAGKQYTVTEAGVAAMRSWLRPPFPSGEISTSLDVLRSRAYFLKLLSPEEIAQFAREARRELAALLEDSEATRQHYERAGDPFSEMAMRGAVRETEARLAWIAELDERFGSVP